MQPGAGTPIRGGAARGAAAADKNWQTRPLGQDPGVGQRNWQTSGIAGLLGVADDGAIGEALEAAWQPQRSAD